MPERIPPGSTIGLLGGGQLGRMFAIAARRMGYRVHTYESSPDSPAGQISDREFTGSYADPTLIDQFVESVDVVTFEFENIPVPLIRHIAEAKPVHPKAEVLHICQNREREKSFLKSKGYPHVEFELVANQGELDRALIKLGAPAVLKTADFGYDGKGQQKLTTRSEVNFDEFPEHRAVLEKWIPFRGELSAICARGQDGAVSSFPIGENIHTDHILEMTVVPGRIPERIQREAGEIAVSIATELGVVGLIAVEFFLTMDDRLLVNELAPRPHNSGHFTFDACVTSQFEQQLRAVCGYPFGSTKLLSPIVMVNLLGDLWKNGKAPDWDPVLCHPNVKLHLYGKSEGRPGRKMGHFTVMSERIEEAITLAQKIKEEISHAKLY